MPYRLSPAAPLDSAPTTNTHDMTSSTPASDHEDPFAWGRRLGLHRPTGPTWQLPAAVPLMTSPLAADREHPLPDFHSVILADRAFSADAYFALPHVVNRLISFHNAGIEMEDVLTNPPKLARALGAVPALTAAALDRPVATLLQQLAPCRALLHMWMRTRCRTALRLDHLTYVPVPPGHAAGTNLRFRQHVFATCLRSLLDHLFSSVWVHQDRADFSPATVQALCMAFALTEQGTVDESGTLERVHTYLAATWPHSHCPNATAVSAAAHTGRSRMFDFSWLAFLHVYDTMKDLLARYAVDLARAHDIDSVDHDRLGDCWDIANYLGLPSGLQPVAEDLDVRPFLDQCLARPGTPSSATQWSRSTQSSTEFEFESVPDSG